MNATITSIGTALPPYKYEQEQLARWMAEAQQDDNAGNNRLRNLYGASGIETRYSVLPDFKNNGEKTLFQNLNHAHHDVPGTGHRMEEFLRNAAPLAEKACKEALHLSGSLPEDFTHLITVSCTGMASPGLDISLMHTLGLPSEIKRTAINFMGCHAAINALQVADAFCQTDPSAKALVVCTELCTLHFKRNGSQDQLLANALFGDGAAAAVVQNKANGKGRLQLKDFYSEILQEGEQAMAWHIGDHGFEMQLTAGVPEVIQNNLQRLADTLATKNNLSLQDIPYYAPHPGGRKILEAAENVLDLSPQNNAAAYEVLRKYGNMSSPTILFVLKELLENSETQKNQHLLSFAFGPGLTVETMLLKTE